MKYKLLPLPRTVVHAFLELLFQPSSEKPSKSQNAHTTHTVLELHFLSVEARPSGPALVPRSSPLCSSLVEGTGVTLGSKSQSYIVWEPGTSFFPAGLLHHHSNVHVMLTAITTSPSSVRNPGATLVDSIPFLQVYRCPASASLPSPITSRSDWTV